MADLLERLKAALADRYQVERDLGSGGMATVYLAQDLKHDRQVAVKVFRPELAAALGTERFFREIKITANLSHPHILPLLDSGEADGFLYYVMPLVEGDSLRDRLNLEKQLSVDDALRITSQVASALSYAHSRDTDRYSGSTDDVFDIQERLARKIVDQLRVSLSPEENRRIAQRPIDNLVAYDCYLRARRELTRWTEDATDRAIELLEKALTLEGPNELLFETVGLAYLGYVIPLPLREYESVLEAADAYATRVFELNPDSSAGHALRGWVLFLHGHNEDAAKHLKNAHRLDPSNADALMCLVLTSMWAGHPDVAHRYHEQLTAINPWSGSNPAWIEFYSGRFEAAIDGYRNEYDVDPDSPYTRWAYAFVLLWSGRIDEGCKIFEQIAKETPNTRFGDFAAVVTKAQQGDADGALLAMTPELIAAAKPHWQMRWMMASLYMMIRRETEALDWLELAVTHGFYNDAFLEREPFLKGLHDNLRFQEIIAEAGVGRRRLSREARRPSCEPRQLGHAGETFDIRARLSVMTDQLEGIKNTQSILRVIKGENACVPMAVHRGNTR